LAQRREYFLTVKVLPEEIERIYYRDGEHVVDVEIKLIFHLAANSRLVKEGFKKYALSKICRGGSGFLS
jgi:hypothetical protein